MIKCNLSRIAGEKKLNRKEIAEQSGIAINTVRALYDENAKAITFDVLNKLCKALNCQVGDMLEHMEVEEDNIKINNVTEKLRLNGRFVKKDDVTE